MAFYSDKTAIEIERSIDNAYQGLKTKFYRISFDTNGNISAIYLQNELSPGEFIYYSPVEFYRDSKDLIPQFIDDQGYKFQAVNTLDHSQYSISFIIRNNLYQFSYPSDTNYNWSEVTKNVIDLQYEEITWIWLNLKDPKNSPTTGSWSPSQFNNLLSKIREYSTPGTNSHNGKFILGIKDTAGSTSQTSGTAVASYSPSKDDTNNKSIIEYIYQGKYYRITWDGLNISTWAGFNVEESIIKINPILDSNNNPRMYELLNTGSSLLSVEGATSSDESLLTDFINDSKTQAGYYLGDSDHYIEVVDSYSISRRFFHLVSITIRRSYQKDYLRTTIIGYRTTPEGDFTSYDCVKEVLGSVNELRFPSTDRLTFSDPSLFSRNEIPRLIGFVNNHTGDLIAEVPLSTTEIAQERVTVTDFQSTYFNLTGSEWTTQIGYASQFIVIRNKSRLRDGTLSNVGKNTPESWIQKVLLYEDKLNYSDQDFTATRIKILNNYHVSDPTVLFGVIDQGATGNVLNQSDELIFRDLDVGDTIGYYPGEISNQYPSWAVRVIHVNKPGEISADWFVELLCEKFSNSGWTQTIIRMEYNFIGTAHTMTVRRLHTKTTPWS